VARVLSAFAKYCAEDQRRTGVDPLDRYGPVALLMRPPSERVARDFGREILPAMLSRSRSDLYNVRRNAVAMLGTLAMERPDLSDDERARIHAAVVAAVDDEDSFVRRMAVRVLGSIGTVTDLDLLRRVAETDPTAVPDTSRFPVRDEARQAIEAIERRSPR
jgi:HEAT repeat protein